MMDKKLTFSIPLRDGDLTPAQEEAFCEKEIEKFIKHVTPLPVTVLRTRKVPGIGAEVTLRGSERELLKIARWNGDGWGFDDDEIVAWMEDVRPRHTLKRTFLAISV